MDSQMVEVTIMCDLYVSWSPYRDKYEINDATVITPRIPLGVRRAIEDEQVLTATLSDKEYNDMVESCTRSLQYEVEVEYVTHTDGAVKVTNKTLQNQGVSNILKAYLENEAEKQFLAEKAMVKA